MSHIGLIFAFLKWWLWDHTIQAIRHGEAHDENTEEIFR